MNALTLPFTSNVQSPAGITIPALAAEAPKARAAPATARLIFLFILIFLLKLKTTFKT
jgi:hypothetical protein